MDYWRNKQFKVLYLEWNSRLIKEGLKDRLDTIASTAYGKASHLERETRREYYLTVEKRVEVTNFHYELHRLIMTLHAQGLNDKEITRQINEIGFQECYRTVVFIIRRYQRLWGLKKWSSRQMNLTTLQNLKKAIG